jgi:SAM-dependent methyltransferase
MNLIDLIRRPANPVPYTEGEKIPWNDPAFSARMLREHLSQAHDAASRRFEIIDRQVAWIHRVILAERPARILDLGCGPGFYTSRLARLGHSCAGIDFSPASIAYATEHARAEDLPITYMERDLRNAALGQGYDLIMLVYGEINPFRQAEAVDILTKARQALVPGGRLLLEAHTDAAVVEMGAQEPSWFSAEAGLFSDRPYVCLTDHAWDASERVATNRYFVIDGATGAVTRHAESLQAYTDDAYRSLLATCGFGEAVFHPSLMGEPDPAQQHLIAIVAS